MLCRLLWVKIFRLENISVVLRNSKIFEGNNEMIQHPKSSIQLTVREKYFVLEQRKLF